MRKRVWLPIVVILTLVVLLACAPVTSSLTRNKELSAETATPAAAKIVTATVERATPVTIPTSIATATPVATALQQSISLMDEALANVYDRVSPSVVHIMVEKNTLSGTGVGTGSGWVWDKEGHIVTNNHVTDGATLIYVRFANGAEVEGQVIGADADSDLAVVQVDVPADTLVPVTLSDSSKLRVGQTAVAIGNPFGFEQTMTSGIVSAIGRISQQASGYSLPNLIQTDTPINPGNSGGPLLDINGNVIGVTTMIYSTTGEFSGIGLAIPVNTVKRVVPSLISDGKYIHAWLGISGMDINPFNKNDLKVNVDSGALVEDVTRNGPAEKAGIQGGTQTLRMQGVTRTILIGGDVIIAINDQKVQGMDDLVTWLEEYRPGDTVTLTIVRNGEQQDIPVVLGERPANAQNTETGAIAP